MTASPHKTTDSFAALRYPEFRFWLGFNRFTTLASRALALALGYQIYELTIDPLALGILGLVEAIPAISLAFVWWARRRPIQPAPDRVAYARDFLLLGVGGCLDFDNCGNWIWTPSIH